MLAAYANLSKAMHFVFNSIRLLVHFSCSVARSEWPTSSCGRFGTALPYLMTETERSQLTM